MPLLLLLLFAQRLYHVVPLPKVATSQQRHVETCGQVVYRRLQADGDWHLTLAVGAVKVVAEFLPTVTWTERGPSVVTPIPEEQLPKKHDWVRVFGIRSYDDYHNWPEIHPVEWWVLAPNRCARGRS
jgi:hypothetical protein